MLHAQLYFLFVFEARNLIFMLFGVNKVIVLVLVLVSQISSKPLTALNRAV